MVAIVILFFFALSAEIFFAVHKIRLSVSPRAQYGLRIIIGIVCTLIFIHNEMPYLIEVFVCSGAFFRLFAEDIWRIVALQVAMVFTYWNLFDGFLNVARGINWFRWGKTKIIDRFFGSHPGLQMIGHFIKWSGMVGGLLNVYPLL
jgi:hypothetical protein